MKKIQQVVLLLAALAFTSISWILISQGVESGGDVVLIAIALLLALGNVWAFGSSVRNREQ